MLVWNIFFNNIVLQEFQFILILVLFMYLIQLMT